jgi:hypothetical protein
MGMWAGRPDAPVHAVYLRGLTINPSEVRRCLLFVGGFERARAASSRRPWTGWGDHPAPVWTVIPDAAFDRFTARG